MYTGSIIELYQANVDILNSHFEGQKGGKFGGVVGAYDNSNVNFKNNVFKNNYAELGGAVYISNANLVTFTDNKFINNTAISHAG